MSILSRFSTRWYGEGGYAEVLRIGIPLIITTGTWSVQHFIDRMFLSWHSPEAIAAAMPAGMLSFAAACIFIGTASYIGTFVAQYYGAGQYARCGPALWQGIYIALIGGVLQMGLIPFAGGIFDAIGHAPEIRECERVYFAILCLGGLPSIVSSAMAAFFSGLGRTRPVMWVNVVVTAANLFLDWLLIFGNGGFPEMGIAGAGIATVCSFVFSVVIYGVLIAEPRLVLRYNTLGGWRFDGELFTRLVRFGFPNGLHFFIEIAGFTVLILLIGRLGTAALAASNIAFNINTLAFMPMIGIGIALSVIVGQRLGDDRPEAAEYAAYSTFHLTFVYMVSMALLYVAWPGLFIGPFAVQADPAEFAEIRQSTIILLRFVAFYSVFDTLNIVFASAIKGAGDTRFVMAVELLLSLCLLVVPGYMTVVVFSKGLYGAWICASIYIAALGMVFYVRFLGGRWKTMRVIGEEAAAVPLTFPEAPTGRE